MHPLVEALLNLFFPTRPGCRLCGAKSDRDICNHCRTWLANWSEAPKCLTCGRPVWSGTCTICGNCSRNRPPFAMAMAAGSYEGCLKESIHRLKYQGRRDLVPVLAELMVEVARQHPGFLESQAVLPVPISPVRLRQRGFNQAELLARHVAKQMELPVLSGTIIKPVDTPPQTGLSGQQRRQNLKDSFKVVSPGDITGKTILLVDDVITTGSTVSTIAEILLRAGAGNIFVITIANAGK